MTDHTGLSEKAASGIISRCRQATLFCSGEVALNDSVKVFVF